MSMVSIETVRNVLERLLSGEHYCTRVWSAWSVGTMTEDDFEEIDIEELVQAILQEERQGEKGEYA